MAIHNQTPSFNLSLYKTSYSYRLPAYRVSHLRRYHPYPRSAPSHIRDLDDSFLADVCIMLSYVLSKPEFSLQTTLHVPYDGPRLDLLLVRCFFYVLCLHLLTVSWLKWQPTIPEESTDDAKSSKNHRAHVRVPSLSIFVEVPPCRSFLPGRR
jgi:hypothetical protein